MNSDGYSRLSGVIGKRAQKELASPPPIELGYIVENLGLKTDHFEKTIPAGQYLRCSGVSIEVGSRVLVAWVGADPIIIDGVVS